MKNQPEKTLKFVKINIHSSLENDPLSQKMSNRSNRYKLRKNRLLTGFVVYHNFLVVLLMILMSFALWPHHSNCSETVVITLACEANSLLYVETEISTSSTACSSRASIGTTTPVASSLCNDLGVLGVNQTCYSQRVYFQREKRLVEVVMGLESTLVVNEDCTDLERHYVYACNNNQSSVEVFVKITHVHISVVLTSFKVFKVLDHQENEAFVEGKRNDSNRG